MTSNTRDVHIRLKLKDGAVSREKILSFTLTQFLGGGVVVIMAKGFIVSDIS